MYEQLEILSKLTKDEQSSILKMISDSTFNLTPIEIDSVVYEIPFPVYDLIDNLVIQVQELRIGKEIHQE